MDFIIKPKAIRTKEDLFNSMNAKFNPRSFSLEQLVMHKRGIGIPQAATFTASDSASDSDSRSWPPISWP